jgi:hypothetical protein
MAWGPGTAVLPNGVPEDRLIGITPDELTVAWFSATGAAGRLLVADRDTSVSAFGAPLEFADNPAALSLSPDGLRLVVLTGERDALTEVTRAARGDDFDVLDDTAFSEVNAALKSEGRMPASALVGPDDRTLYYTIVATSDVLHPLFVSSRAGSGPWPAGDEVAACEFDARGPYTRVPTGLSSDGLTLFFFDAAREVARAAFRETEGDAFSWFIDLPDLLQPQVNAACDRIYYSSSSDFTGLLAADAE